MLVLVHYSCVLCSLSCSSLVESRSQNMKWRGINFMTGASTLAYVVASVACSLSESGYLGGWLSAPGVQHTYSHYGGHLAQEAIAGVSELLQPVEPAE